MSPNTIWILDDGSKASHCAVRPMEDETAKNWELAGAVCADELANTMIMEKVRFQGMGTHFSIPRMNERNCKKIEELRMENDLLKKLQAFLKQKNV